MNETAECTHLDTITDVKPASRGCDQCIAAGDSYPDARYCTVCGFVGCCDGAKGHHMIDHHRETGHPIIKAINPRETWAWCYVDEVYVAS